MDGTEFYWGGQPIHPRCRSIYILIQPDQTNVATGSLEKAALQYLWLQIVKGQDYIWLTRMSRELNMHYELCESFVTKFLAGRLIPRLEIVEECEE